MERVYCFLSYTQWRAMHGVLSCGPFVFQGAYGNGTSKSYELKLGNFLRIGSVGVVVSEIHTGAGGEHKCLSWEELTCLKGDIAAIQKVNILRSYLNELSQHILPIKFPCFF